MAHWCDLLSSFEKYIVLGFSRWFHGKIGRDKAEHLLTPPFDGMFLVRESTNFPGDYTLCVSFSSRVEHYHIIYRNNLLTIDEEEMFETLAQLVEVSHGRKRGPLLLFIDG